MWPGPDPREFEQAIEALWASDTKTYENDSGRLAEDAGSYDWVVADHQNRWFYELLQNADDAKADKVHVGVEKGILYFADNGKGFSPETVESVSRPLNNHCVGSFESGSGNPFR